MVDLTDVLANDWWVAAVDEHPDNHLGVPDCSPSEEPTNCVQFSKGRELDPDCDRVWIGHLCSTEPSVLRIGNGLERMRFVEQFASQSVPVSGGPALSLVRWRDVHRLARSVVDDQRGVLTTWDTASLFDVQEVIVVAEWVDPDHWHSAESACNAVRNYFAAANAAAALAHGG